MNKKEKLLNSLGLYNVVPKSDFKISKKFLLLLLILAFCISCKKEESVDERSDININNIEGTYFGIFTDQHQHEKAYEGNVTIKRLTSGTYNIDLICDGHGLHEKAEGVNIYEVPDSKLGLRIQNDFGDEFPEWWHVSGSPHPDGLYLICSKQIYGNSKAEGSALYYFRNGKKRN